MLRTKPPLVACGKLIPPGNRSLKMNRITVIECSGPQFDVVFPSLK
jgi:hypothetical protein